MDASVALTVGAGAINSSGSSTTKVDVSKKISGNTLTMKVKITEKAKKKEEAKLEESMKEKIQLIKEKPQKQG